jgi:hypothetical protein
MPSMRRRALMQALAGAALGGPAMGGLLHGCGGNSAAADSGSGALNPQPIPNGRLSAVSIRISNTTAGAGAIGARFVGLSYEKNSMALPRFAPDNADLISMFTGLGPSLLRIGGNSVDQTHWAASGPGRTGGQVAPADIDALAGFLEQTGWTVLYGVNLATSTPAAAASEVAYAAHALGDSLYGVEIGNECDLYGGHYFQTWSLADFERLWGRFRSAILHASPEVPLTGPASAGNITNWTIPFGQSIGSAQISLLTQHYYRGNGQSPSSTDLELISADAALLKDLSELAAGASSIGIPFRIAETNSYYNGGAPGVSDSYASALWIIDHLFNIALAGAAGANLHGGGNGMGYTPIADSNGAVIEARPEYYGALLFSLAGQGVLFGTSVAAAGLDVTAYAVGAASGALNIVVVNKEASRNLRLSIDCGQSVRSAEALVLKGSALNATGGVTIQGAAVTNDGGLDPNPPYTARFARGAVSCYLEALSAILIQVT